MEWFKKLLLIWIVREYNEDENSTSYNDCFWVLRIKLQVVPRKCAVEAKTGIDFSVLA